MYRYLFLTIFLTLLVLLISWLLYAKFSKPMKWPFVKKHEGIKVLGLSTTVLTDDNSVKSQLGKVGALIFMIFIVSVMITVTYWGIMITLKRYEIAGQAIKQGNTGVAVAALAPEIGSGINNIFNRKM